MITILQIILLNSLETIFLFLFILFSYTGRTKINKKDIVLMILISISSNFIQTYGLPTIFSNIIGIFLYYIIFRFFYFKDKKLKLLQIIILSFVSLLFIQITTYTPLILFLNLNIIIIQNNVFYLFLIRIPIDLICFVILLFKKERMDENENRRIID
ncbi:hypothetical protein CLFE_013580 [Clostridium felsineum DSM 794]|nr:hypothetical protein CLFE_013580 [Clostridium felsineum DSM 794]